jgi:hypothetical protein
MMCSVCGEICREKEKLYYAAKICLGGLGGLTYQTRRNVLHRHHHKIYVLETSINLGNSISMYICW